MLVSILINEISIDSLMITVFIKVSLKVLVVETILTVEVVESVIAAGA